MSIGENIRKYRNQKGLTQSQLAEKTHITRQQLGNYEGDKIDPPALALVAISNVLEVTPNNLLEGYIKVPRVSEDTMTQLVYLLRKLDPASLSILQDTIKLIQQQNG